MLIKTKAPTEQASGAQGQELVFFRWKGAQIARNWAQPSNPKTTAQQSIRGYLTTLSRNWGDVLTPTERDLWNAYAVGREFTNILGDTYECSGFNAYVQHNMILSMRGDSLITEPPTTSAPSPYTALTTLFINGANYEITGNHGNTTLTGLKVFVRAQFDMSNGQAADIRKSVAVGTTFAKSFDTCPTSGAAFSMPAADWRNELTNTELVGLSLIVTNTLGQCSPAFTYKIEVSV